MDFIETHIRGHRPTARNPLPLIEQDASDYHRFIALQHQCSDLIERFFDSDGEPLEGDADAAEAAYKAACVSPCIWDEDEDPMCQARGGTATGADVDRHYEER